MIDYFLMPTLFFNNRMPFDLFTVFYFKPNENIIYFLIKNEKYRNILT